MAKLYQVTPGGNFDHSTTVLTRAPNKVPRAVHESARARLLEVRSQRKAPPTDTKRVVAYNGLLISGLARSGRLLDRPGDVVLARAAAKSIIAARGADGTLPRTLERNAPRAVLDDYAYMIEGLLDLYEADLSLRWLLAAESLATVVLTRFWDPVDGGFFYADPSATELLVRQKAFADGARPSGYGRMLSGLVRLQAYGSAAVRAEHIQKGLEGAGRYLERSPSSVPTLLGVLEGMERPSMQVVIAAPPEGRQQALPFVAVYNESYRPYDTLAVIEGEAGEDNFDAFQSKGGEGNKVSVFVCFDGICKQPVNTPAAMRQSMAGRPVQ